MIKISTQIKFGFQSISLLNIKFFNVKTTVYLLRDRYNMEKSNQNQWALRNHPEYDTI